MKFGQRKSDGERAQVCDGCVRVSMSVAEFVPRNVHLVPFIS